MTTVSERRIIREIEDDKNATQKLIIPPGGSPISGILKGGRLWKQSSLDSTNVNKNDQVCLFALRFQFAIKDKIGNEFLT